jgi:hypothetical protein
MNGTRVRFDALLDGIRQIPDVVVQSLFVEDPAGRCGNSRIRDREAWLDAVRSVRPSRVHLYTIDRAPALARLRPVSRFVLQGLADTLAGDGIAADVF